MSKHPVYLWTLPMFHCNGWCFPWTVAARAGVNVCLRRVEAAIVEQMRAWGVTHYCGAPVVHAMIANAPEALLLTGHEISYESSAIFDTLGIEI